MIRSRSTLLKHWIVREKNRFNKSYTTHCTQIAKQHTHSFTRAHTHSRHTTDNDDRECLLCRIHTAVQSMGEAETPDNNWMERRTEIQATNSQQQRQKINCLNRMGLLLSLLESERHIVHKFRFTCTQHDMEHTHAAHEHTQPEFSTTN